MTLASPPGVAIRDAHGTARRLLAAVGIAEPAALTRICDIDAALAEVTHEDPTDALASKINAGKITPAQALSAALAAASTLAAAQLLAEVRTRLAPTLDRAARTALAAEADRIFDDLKPTFDTAVAAVLEGLDAFGPGAPPKDALRAPAVAALWERASAARNQLGAVVAVRTALSEVGYGPPLESSAWWVTTTDDLDRAPHGLTRIIEAGIPVNLNSAEDIDRLTAARDAEAARAAEERAARKAREAENNPMARALARAKARDAAHYATQPGGPKDAA